MSARLELHSLILIFSFATVQAGDIPSIVEKTKPAVVEIVTFDQQNKPLKTGTGFFVSSDGALLTNFHVISGASSILAKTPTGAVYFLKSVIAESESDDVAKLQFLATDVPYLTLGSSLKTVQGQRVLVIGNPEGLEGTVSDGIISAFRSDRSVIQITAPISPGSSGSPVLDETGQVIGMATLVSKEGQNLNFAISAEAIKEAVQPGLARTSPTPTQEPSVAVVPPTPTWPPPRVVLDPPQVVLELWSKIPMRASTEADQKVEKDVVKNCTEEIRVGLDDAGTYAGRGMAYFELGLYEKAVMDLSEAIRLKSTLDMQAVYQCRGNAYFGLEKYESAISDYTEVIRSRPYSFSVYCLIGTAYLRLKQYERAITNFTEAIRLMPYLGAAYYTRGYAYHILGDDKAANADLEQSKKQGYRNN